MTARPEDLAGLPGWPRLLSRAQAAAYLGVSAGTLDTHVAVVSLRVGGRRVWDRHALDDFVDALGDRRKVGNGKAAEDRATCNDDIDWGDIVARRADHPKFLEECSSRHIKKRY